MNAITLWRPQLDSVYQFEATALLRQLAPQSVDAIITDLPYQTTALKWDVMIPFDALWSAVRHALKPRGVFVTTASQPFTSALVMSNPQMFKYAWVWIKTKASNHTNANNRPMTQHEDIPVFSSGTIANGSPLRMDYFPQDVKRVDRAVYRPSSKFGGYHHSWDKEQNAYIQQFEHYPTTVLRFANPNNESQHPTQKPVALYEYLIRTYTQAGDLVVDPCMGSGTTLVAARNTERRYIGCDLESEYVELARMRLQGRTREYKDAKAGKPTMRHMFAEDAS